MNYDIKWSFAADYAIRAMPMRHAEDAAILKFARTGKGQLLRAQDDLLTRRLLVGSYVVCFSINQ